MAPRLNSELKPLVELVKKKGYKVVPGGKHHRLVDSSGAVVTDENGPLILSGTAGDVRNRDATVTRWVRAGVITNAENPWLPDKGNENGGNGHQKDPEKVAQMNRAREVKIAGDKERSERTRKIRARWEPIMARLGGWEKRGMTAEVGLVLYHFGRSLGREETPANVTSASQNVIRLRRGDTFSNKSAVLWELLLDDLEKRPLDLPIRWAELVREAKGLGPPEGAKPPIRVHVAELPRPSNGGEKRADDEEVEKFGPAYVTPTVALQALALMMAGVDADASEHREASVDLATKILALELRGR